ncbi:MAG: hypothetical protein ABUT39_13310 [Acidobacteriota bacterium]
MSLSLKTAGSVHDKNYTPLQGRNDGHPPIDRLRDYHQGQLTETEEGNLQEHFVACRECRERMLEPARFLDGVAESARWDPEELVQEWLKVRAALRQDDTEAVLPATRNS